MPSYSGNENLALHSGILVMGSRKYHLIHFVHESEVFVYTLQAFDKNCWPLYVGKRKQHVAHFLALQSSSTMCCLLISSVP